MALGRRYTEEEDLIIIRRIDKPYTSQFADLQRNFFVDRSSKRCNFERATRILLIPALIDLVRSILSHERCIENDMSL